MLNSLNISRSETITSSQHTRCASPVCLYEFDNMSAAEIYHEFHKGKSNNMGYYRSFVFSKLVSEQQIGKHPIVKNIPVDMDDWSANFKKKIARTKADIIKQKQTFSLQSTSCANGILRKTRKPSLNSGRCS